MSKRNPNLYFQDILKAIEKIETYTQNLTSDEFTQDPKTFDAVIYNISVIGEAKNNIPTDIKSKNPNVPWKEISSMRNKLIHEYFGIDEDIVWQTIKTDIKFLKTEITKMTGESLT